MATAHISSDMPTKALTTLMEDSAADHAKKGDTTYGVDNLPSLSLLFRKLKEKKARLTHVDFHTHGSPGSLAIGSDHLNRTTLLRDFAGRGFDAVFAKDARIFFHGCNIAEKAVGELFLAEVAVTFLKSGGGRVGEAR